MTLEDALKLRGQLNPHTGELYTLREIAQAVGVTAPCIVYHLTKIEPPNACPRCGNPPKARTK